LTVLGDEYVGDFATGVFNQTGGTHVVNNSLQVGNNASTLGTFNLSGGLFYRGFGGRYSVRYTGESRLNGSGLPNSTNLFFDNYMTVDLRVFADLNQQTNLIKQVPFLKGTRISFGVDNRTQSGLGSGQLRATAQANSLLRDGDRTDLVLLGATDLERYQYVGLSHQTPLGSDGLTLGLSGSWLRTRLKNFPVTGEAKSAGVSLSYPVMRGYKRNLTVSAGIDGLDSDAALLGAVLSSDHIRAARAAVGYSRINDKDVLTVGLTVSRGLDILNARGTPGFTDAVFTKVTARAGYDRMLGKRFVGRLRMTGQYSADRLSGNERLAIGGPDYGRAFDTALLSGDRGIAGSLELAVRPELTPRLKGTEIYGFIDGAKVRVNSRADFPASDYGLASAGGGVRLAYASKASLGLEAARVIDAPFPGTGDWRLNISWHWKLNR